MSKFSTEKNGRHEAKRLGFRYIRQEEAAHNWASSSRGSSRHRVSKRRLAGSAQCLVKAFRNRGQSSPGVLTQVRGQGVAGQPGLFCSGVSI